MSITLTRGGRAVLLFLSAAAYVAWFAGLGDRIEAETGQETTSSMFAPVPPTLPANIGTTISRDPFAGGPAPVGSPPDADPRRTALPPVMSHPAIADVGGYAVPNIDVSDAADASSELKVRATIVGPNAVAYVENGTVMDIVRVGDSLGNERVATIDLRGITFADGTRLELPDGYAATPAPSRMPQSAIALQLEGLRRLLSRRAMATAAPLPIPVPQPTPAGTYPTPAPLRTANSQGIPVGVNPTSDPNAPTPYPYPYPYAPPR